MHNHMPDKLVKIIRHTAAAALSAAAMLLTGCDSLIYQYEGDCDPHYKARFVFDYNMLETDAFASQVKAVKLYLIDPASGDIVWQGSDSGDALRAEGYTMDLPVEPGTYEFVAWCGEGAGTHFAIPTDATHHTHLTSTLGRSREDDGSASVCNDILPLFHGYLEAQTFPDDEGTFIFKVPLVKDTNDVNIVLQHLSGEEVSKDDYTFTIVDNNGSMDWDNSLMPDETLTYMPHHIWQGTAGTGGEMPSKADISSITACMAEHTVARLVKGQDTRVIITNKKGHEVVNIPLIDYALMVKHSHCAHMTDQEFLDRQDKYDIVFFLDKNDHWTSAHIHIQSWTIVKQNVSLGS